MQTPQLPKGTRDFYPEDQRVQNHIFSTWRQASLRFGYEEYEGPMFEHLELFTAKSGDEIVTQLYNFVDKGGRAIALRPEMTPSLARLVIQKGNAIKKPFKWFSMPRLFRYERAQKGRLREFFQLNLDILGSDSVYAEADLLTAIAAMMSDFGLTAVDYTIGVSSRKMLNAFLEELGVIDPAKVYPVLDRRAKMKPEEFAAELAKTGLDDSQCTRLDTFMQCKSLPEVQAQIAAPATVAACDELVELFRILTAAGIADCVGLDLSVVRGLAYYTGIVFEVFDKGKNMRAVAGGGRYDSLTEVLGGQKVPGVGFGMGDVVLADLLRDRGLLPVGRSDLHVYLASFTNNMPALFQVASELRALGLHCSHPLSPAKLGKQMELANAAGAFMVVYVDGEKAPAGEYEYKILSNGTTGCATPQALVHIAQPAK